MILLISGAFLLALGLFSGAVLVMVPLGLVPWSSGELLWLLFPLFCLGGYMLLAMAARSASMRPISMLASGALLLLAALSALGLVLDAAAIRAASGTLSLWYVLAVAGSLGLLGAASWGRTAAAE